MLFGLGFVEIISLLCIGVLRGVFLANHLASTDNLTSNNQETEHMNGSLKEPNKFHNYVTEKITRKASDAAEYIELFDSFTRDRHARRI